MKVLISLVLMMAACHARYIAESGIDEIIAEASRNVYDKINDDGSVQVEMDILYTPEQWAILNGPDPQKGMRDERYRWPNNTIPFEAEDVFSATEWARIEEGMKEWEKFTCIRFKPRTDEPDYIQFVNGDGCTSYVGRIGRGQKVTLAQGCRIHRIIVHEIGHAVGFHHEHKRPDRDGYVTINFDNIQDRYTFAFQKLSDTLLNSFNVPYDYKSVMHYGEKAFSKNNQPTIITRDTTMQKQIGKNPTLSARDIQLANAMYKCGDWCNEAGGYVRSCPPNGFVNQFCTCWCPIGGDLMNPVYMCGLGGPNISTTDIPTRATTVPTRGTTTTSGTGTGPTCIRTCTGKTDGDYQSCTSCDIYVSCVNGRPIGDRPCAPGTKWDDRFKMCLRASSTCTD